MHISVRLTKRHFLLLMALLSILGGTYYFFRGERDGVTIFPQPKRDVWLTVFMHGSFGTMLGLLSFFKVMSDNVENTYYKKITSSMRYDPYFYQTQPLLAPGLHTVLPTFNPLSVFDETFEAAAEGVVQKNELRKYAVYPVSAAYKMLSSEVSDETEYFYAFGWSGLVSQYRRRKEAIRFYNVLQEERAKYEAKGVYPKIRIIVHSHGGNVALNLAAVAEILQNGLETPPVRESYASDDAYDTAAAMYTLLIGLPHQRTVSEERHQKKWDYRPVSSSLWVDELIMLGTPIQPETAHLASSDFFTRVYNIYSPNDKVQRMDWVSTRRAYSQQKIDVVKAGEEGPRGHLIQVELTVNKNIEDLEVIHDSYKAQDRNREEQRWWHTLFTSPGLTAAETNPDPQHKELWFMQWQKEQKPHAQDFIAPYPYAIFVPIIRSLVLEHFRHDAQVSEDLAVTCSFNEHGAELALRDYTTLRDLAVHTVPQSTLQELKERSELWKPTLLSPQNQMQLLHRYSQLAQLAQ